MAILDELKSRMPFLRYDTQSTIPVLVAKLGDIDNRCIIALSIDPEYTLFYHYKELSEELHDCYNIGDPEFFNKLEKDIRSHCGFASS